MGPQLFQFLQELTQEDSGEDVVVEGYSEEEEEEGVGEREGEGEGEGEREGEARSVEDEGIEMLKVSELLLNTHFLHISSHTFSLRSPVDMPVYIHHDMCHTVHRLRGRC